MRSKLRVSSHLLALSLVLGCAPSVSGIVPRGLPTEAVPMDLARFMGSWFVIAHIPTGVEADAHEAIERYALTSDGQIDIRFDFCEGSVDGPSKELTMRGWVHDPQTNAEWRVRPIWPLRLGYQILELDASYTRTVVVNESGGYAWIMARRPGLPEAEIEAIAGRLADRGFDIARLRRVPHDDGICGAETSPAS